jgi:hypothetical protein
MECSVCDYDLANVFFESMIGPRSVYPAPLQPVQRLSTKKTTQSKEEHAAKHRTDGSPSGNIPPTNR